MPMRSVAGSEHLVLIGLMGSGKSTVGRIVAARLGRPLADSDAIIEARTGETVKQIREEQGTEAMRRHEADALFDALARSEPHVIAAAAGVVTDAADRARLAGSGAFVVWLDGPPEVLGPRAAGGVHRPFLDDDPVGTLRTMRDLRAPWYREVADRVVPIGRLTPDEIADRVLS